jgi:hypothetical protein
MLFYNPKINGDKMGILKNSQIFILRGKISEKWGYFQYLKKAQSCIFQVV